MTNSEIMEFGTVGGRSHHALDYLQNRIENIEYKVFDFAPVVSCCVTLKSGFTAIGRSVCKPVNFDEAIGREYALRDALCKAMEYESRALATFLTAPAD